MGRSLLARPCWSEKMSQKKEATATVKNPSNFRLKENTADQQLRAEGKHCRMLW